MVLHETLHVRDRFEWFYNGKTLVAYRYRESKRQSIFEIHVIDLVIDEETGDILEIHILPNEYEAPDLIKFLKEKNLLKEESRNT